MHSRRSGTKVGKGGGLELLTNFMSLCLIYFLINLQIYHLKGHERWEDYPSWEVQ